MENPQKIALVTGAAKRVGCGIVHRLADAGFDIAFTYFHSDDDAKAVLREVENKGRQCVAIQADLTDPAAAVNAIDARFSQTFGGLDVLVNNASLYEQSGLDQTNLKQMRRLWAIHAESPMLLCKRFESRLRKSRGHVVNMVDLLAERPWPEYLAYCASKAALWNLTLGLARELSPEVTVNGIAPGVVQWPKDYPLEEQEKYLKRVPLNRAGTPEDVAGAVLFFCTTGTYVTGQILRLDGGRSIT